jgi:transposase-like protein
MRYTKEQRLAWVRAYKEGRLDASTTPSGVARRTFTKHVAEWAKIYDRFGEKALETSAWRPRSTESKLGAVMRVESGETASDVSRSLMMKSNSLVLQWVKAYRRHGPDGLESKPKGRRPKGVPNKKRKPAGDGELEYLRTENAYLKKLLELERKAASSGSSRRKPSKPSGKKGTD